MARHFIKQWALTAHFKDNGVIFPFPFKKKLTAFVAYSAIFQQWNSVFNYVDVLSYVACLVIGSEPHWDISLEDIIYDVTGEDASVGSQIDRPRQVKQQRSCYIWDGWYNWLACCACKLKKIVMHNLALLSRWIRLVIGSSPVLRRYFLLCVHCCEILYGKDIIVGYPDSKMRLELLWSKPAPRRWYFPWHLIFR